MNTHPQSAWIDAVFSSFDFGVLSLLHGLTVETQAALTPAFVLWGMITDNGLIFLAVGLVLLGPRGTRALGTYLLGAVSLAGALGYALKLAIGRPRPFLTAPYHLWWQSLGLSVESGFAFPSGHVTVVMATATVLFLFFEKRWSWVFFLPVVFTGLSRCFLLVHYPSDVLGGMAVGLVTGVLAVLTLRRLGVNR